MKPRSITAEDKELAQGIIALWEKDRIATSKEIAYARGYTRQAAEWYLNRLQDHGLIVRLDKGYEVNKRLPEVFYNMLTNKYGYSSIKMPKEKPRKLIQDICK